ncbi:leucine-rich repeat flightless-interacting protein 1 isoform X12 [Podarcis raffonei]|uniref:leucine-rich repeat flightless-interacting protein 1 isoform X12 n=1 Tax=Podarcis raffonei TaxID=65483 RepID=UPI00232925D6|nr:leucine-rich repeat flightless-interacting protein 1 isoform X12 [Podarcis raffonei]
MELVGAQQAAGGLAGRKRQPNRERPAAAEDDALNQIAREAEARLAAKRAARAEAREIRMKELERQQKEIYQIQKKYYGLDTKFGDIEQWMEDSERYTRKSRRNASASDEDERMSVGSRGSLRTGLETERTKRMNFKTPSEYSCYLGSGSRASSRASSARASPVVEERPEKDFEKGVRTVSSLSAATLASLGGTSSRRGSGDTSISVDTEASIREIKDINELKDQIQDVEGKYMQGLKEMKDSLAEVEEKYKKAMVSNAQLDNEKTNFMYQVDTLKDALLELEEQLAESKRQYEEKNKDFEREKHAHTVLRFQFMEVKETLKQREELLAEIRQLQQKQEGYVREMSDLQETIEWKEKKIGALERQKEFFDSIRSERDDLREEVIVLKEQLKRHGIIPNSEVATNGETSGDLDNDGLQSSSNIAPGSTHAPKVAGDDTLGRAKEVEMKNEILENVGKKEILQNTEHEEHTEETKEQEIVQECSEIKTLHADENAEAEKITEGKVASTLLLNSGPEEPAKRHSEHVPGIVCSLENSGIVELRGEGGFPDDTIEVKESDGNVVNKSDTEVACSGMEGNEQIQTDIEILPQQQDKDKQTHIVGDEAEGDNNEVFQEALDFVNNSHVATSSQSESPELAEDLLLKVPSIDPYIEQPESKIVEGHLLEGRRIKLIDKADGDKNETGGINEENETEHAVQRQACEVAAEQTEISSASDESEEQKQVGMEKSQPLSSKDETFVEEEQTMQVIGASEKNEENPAMETDQRAALAEALDVHLDFTMKEVHTEETAADGVSHSECQIPEERNLDHEDDSKKCGDIQSEFIDDGKTVADIQIAPEEVAGDNNEEDYKPAEEQSVNIQGETFQESAGTACVNIQGTEVNKGNEEDKNHEKTEEKILDIVPDTEKAPCVTSQKTELSDQERKLDNDEEEGEAVEEYHEAFDFAESPFGQQETTERNDNLNNELETNNHQTQEKVEITEHAAQNIIKKDTEMEYRDAEENKKGKTYQALADEVINESTVTESENTQQQKGKELEEAAFFQTDPSASVASEAQCEILEDPSKKMSDEISIDHIAEYTAEQLEKLKNDADESEEEVQVGRKGKGKSREDCVIS